MVVSRVVDGVLPLLAHEDLHPRRQPSGDGEPAVGKIL
jgi:hypothetical protein